MSGAAMADVLWLTVLCLVTAGAAVGFLAGYVTGFERCRRPDPQREAPGAGPVTVRRPVPPWLVPDPPSPVARPRRT